MADLAEQYADLGLGGTNASVIPNAERLRIEHVATSDRRHFTVVRPEHIELWRCSPYLAVLRHRLVN